MQHRIPVESLGPGGGAMARAVEACVHCGFCLPACPTYRVLGEEMDSPRGRILLMKSALEGSLTVEDTQPFIDRCLGCLACVTACPSGVQYGELLPLYRAHVRPRHPAPVSDRVAHALLQATLPSPAAFRLATRAAALARPVRHWLPARFAAMVALAPRELHEERELPSLVPAAGRRRARVALLLGCVQRVLAPAISEAAARVLAANGVEVVVPPEQGCCGALAWHTGEPARARALARVNLAAFPPDIDAIVTTAAGCGSAMKHSTLMFAGEPDCDAATEWAGRVRDVCEFLADLGADAFDALPAPLTAAYQDACHLVHGQGVVDAPRRLLAGISNLTLVEIAERDLCCGSAGTYNVDQPEIAAQLGRRKASHILDAGAEVVVSGNIGCLVQIAAALDALGRPLPVLHTVELLDRACRRPA